MVVRRTSTVVAEARTAARQRRATVLEERRRREEKVSALADGHAVALALADEVQARADEEIARHRRTADAAVVQLLELGERTEAVGDLLGLTAAEVRAARRRVRDEGGSSEPVADAVQERDETSASTQADVSAVDAVAVADAEVTSPVRAKNVAAAA